MSRLDVSPEALAPRLAAFLQTQWGRPVRLDSWRRYPAGFSWITIGFTARFESGSADEDIELILRVGDPRGMLAPYRSEPEFKVLSELQHVAGLPVPRVHAFSDDDTIIGAPFLITGRVQGDTPMPWKGNAEQREPQENESLSRDFVDALVALHGVPWQGTSLRGLWPDADPGRVAQQQVAYWSRHASLDRPGRHAPQMHYAKRWLESRAPAADRVTIVHGDFRVGNFLQQDGRITAVLDWELVHAGDPHEDLAWAGLRVFAAGTERIGGLIERDMFYRRYAQGAGFELRPNVIHYYEVLGLFKSVAMLLSAVQRIESGRADDIRMVSMGFQVASTLLEINRVIAEAE